MTTEEPRWLDEDEQRAWRAYVRMQAKLSGFLERDIQANTSLSMPDFVVLVALTDTCRGGVRAFSLAETLQWEKSRLSHHLARMEKRGLITRAGCTEDGRGQQIAVTPAGRAAIEAAAPHHVDTVRRVVFDVLEPQDVAALERIAGHVLAKLDAERAARGCPPSENCDTGRD
jgi:DNA-binding MarR family transcriptional regulator